MVNKNKLSNIRDNIALKAIATGVAASALVGLGIGIDELSRPDSLSEKEQIQLAQDEAYGATSADKLADYYTEKLNNSGQKVMLPVLRGTVYEKGTGNGKPTAEIKNPILLGLHSKTGKGSYDAKGDFLVGGYLGLASNDKDNKIKITVVPYGYDEVSFRPEDPTSIVINANAFSETNKEGATLVAFDVNAQHAMTNADGSQFIIGELVGRK